MEKQNKLELMTHGGVILKKALALVIQNIKDGADGIYLNKIAESYIIQNNAKPAFKGYQGFPATLCVSVNNVIVHGIPNKIKFKPGDIVGLDLGVKFMGLNTDSATTVLITKDGCRTVEEMINTSHKEDFSDLTPKERLICTAFSSLVKGIAQAKVGSKTGDIGYAIQSYVENNGFAVVRELVGHGVGEKIHQEPNVPNFGNKNTGSILFEGQTIAIEPMLTNGDWRIKLANDNWSILTADNSLSAHFEHTVYISENGPIILT